MQILDEENEGLSLAQRHEPIHQGVEGSPPARFGTEAGKGGSARRRQGQEGRQQRQADLLRDAGEAERLVERSQSPGGRPPG